MAICGIVATEQARLVETAALESMVGALALRPGWSRASQVQLNVGVGAASPVGTASLASSEQILVVCDADLYNRNELEAAVSHPPCTSGLADLFATLYLHHGPRFLEKLRGVFSLAIWDARKRMLLLAVDRFGVKPLCYAVSGSEVVFASQPRGLFASRRVACRVNPQAIVGYLDQTVVPAPESAFEGVTKLPPGSFLLWEAGNVRIDQYWDIKYPEDARSSTEDLARELLGRMEEAVRITSADVPADRLGCFLSGGTDSSSVVGLVTQLNGQPANSFSIGFSEERFNELNYAHIAARHFATNHTEIFLKPDEAFATVPKIIEIYDEPFGNSSAIPTYHCHLLARQCGVQVMLAGDGGDELFGGNERYRTHEIYELYQKIPRALRRNLIEPLLFEIPLSVAPLEKLRRYVRGSNTPNPERYCRWLLLERFPAQQILAPNLLSGNGQVDPLDIVRTHYRAAPARSELNRLLYVDVKMTLGDNDLPKVVRTAELAGVQVRFPLLDHPLAEFSGRIPAHLKVHGLEKRYLFKRATRNLLPKAILKKKKHGFGLPIGMWLKNHRMWRGWAEEVLLDSRTYQRGYFQREFIEQLFRSMDQVETTYYGDLLWLFLVLELWHRQHVEGRAS